MSILYSLTLVALVQAMPAPSDATVRAEWRELGSRYFRVRHEAEQRLWHLPRQQGQQIAELLLAAPEPMLRKAAAGWYRLALAKAEIDGAVALLVDAVERESDAAVQQDLVLALARTAAGVDVCRQRFAEDRLSGRVLDALIDARMTMLFEAIMHDGRVPGFFDGQFASLHVLDKTVYGRLVRIAWDARVHFVVRTLAIMALHEPRQPDLARYLQPLLLQPKAEVVIQDDFEQLIQARLVDNFSLRRLLLARVSQYARFSMAKAGVAEPIQAKIEVLTAISEEDLRTAELVRDANDSSLYWLNRAMDHIFEIGYHYQQLDDYANAEVAYRRIIDRVEAVYSKCWAHYNLACIRSIQGRIDEAIAELTAAFATGLRDPGWAIRDGDLAPLRNDPRFQSLIADVQSGKGPSAPSAIDPRR